MAVGVFHLDCPVTHLAHVLVWHGGAVVVLALLGAGLGLALESRERRTMVARIAARRA
jgi:hypothetical protein